MSMYFLLFFLEIMIFVQFNKTSFCFLYICFPQENAFISVDIVDNLVYKSFYHYFFPLSMWISCERIKE